MSSSPPSWKHVTHVGPEWSWTWIFNRYLHIISKSSLTAKALFKLSFACISKTESSYLLEKPKRQKLTNFTEFIFQGSLTSMCKDREANPSRATHHGPSWPFFPDSRCSSTIGNAGSCWKPDRNASRRQARVEGRTGADGEWGLTAALRRGCRWGKPADAGLGEACGRRERAADADVSAVEKILTCFSNC